MPRWSLAPLSLLVLGGSVGCGVLGCGAAAGEDAAAQDRPLIAGDPAEAARFPATVRIVGACTASKVGPRHLLLAAHCVTRSGWTTPAEALRPDYQRGATLVISPSAVQPNRPVDGEDPGRRSLTIARTHVHPALLAGGDPYVVGLVEAPPDVAVIEVDAASAAALADLPVATVDLDAASPGDGVVILGFGCEAVLDDPSPRSRRLKGKRTHLLPLTSQLHAGGYFSAVDEVGAQNAAAQYHFTPGAAYGQATAPDPSALDEHAQASLCFGDSGGPVYRDDGAARWLVGVNVWVSQLPASADPYLVSVTNWHARLDAASRFAVGDWLASLEGVAVGRSRAVAR